MPFHDIRDGVTADSQVSGDPPVAPTLPDSLDDLRSEPVRFRSLPGLPTEFLSPRLRRRQSRPDPFAQQVTFEQAKDMQVFTEPVPRYMFELPGMLEKARGDRENLTTAR